MILYDYYRSSASYRVRIALNLKALNYQTQTINLLESQQLSPVHKKRNPQQLVPVLVDNENTYTQSMAICEYLDDAYPDTHQLLTGDANLRCKIRSFSQAIACEIHPLNNLRILKYLENHLQIDDRAKKHWYQHWVHQTFSALERQLNARSTATDFCFTQRASLADVCLIPQLYNARRFNVDLQSYPLLLDIERHCLALQAFKLAHPDA